MEPVSCPDFVKSPDCVFVFDVTAFLHRALHVCYGDKVNETPQTDAAFVRHAGKMIANVVRTLNVNQMVIALDSTESSPRCDWYPDYKSGRKAHVPVFAAQAPRFYEALERAGAIVVGESRYEADDIIASLLLCRDFPICIVSSDKDLLQHVRDDVIMYDAMKDVFMDHVACENKFGVRPDQLPDYTGLVGDSSDGIPGVPGFGAKTAAKLMRRFDSLDRLYATEQHAALADFVTAKQLATLQLHQSDAFLSRRLARPVIWNECPSLTCESELQAPKPAEIREHTERL